MLTVVGEIARSEVRTYRDRRSGRPAYRLETVLRTDGPSLKMTFFAKQKSVSEWQARRLRSGPSGRRAGCWTPRRFPELRHARRPACEA